MDADIVLYLASDDAKLTEAITTHRDYIAAETLATQWATSPLGEVPIMSRSRSSRPSW